MGNAHGGRRLGLSELTLSGEAVQFRHQLRLEHVAIGIGQPQISKDVGAGLTNLGLGSDYQRLPLSRSSCGSGLRLGCSAFNRISRKPSKR